MYQAEMLDVARLRDISDFSLDNIIINKDFKIQVRFDNFENAYLAYQTFSKENRALKLTKDESKKVDPRNMTEM